MATSPLGLDAPAAPSLSRALVEGLDKAVAEVGSGRHRHAAAIHEFRKAMKRHRALLRLAQPLRGEAARAERHQAGALARRLSGARDLTAALEGLEDLAGKKLTRADDAAPVQRALEAAREAAGHASLDDDTRAAALDFLNGARADAEALAAADLPLRALIAGIAKSYRRMVKAAPDDWAAAPAEALHELRKAVVIHRYQMELARPLWPQPIELWIDESQKLRDRLGKAQDLEALARFVTAEPDLLDAARRKRLVAAIRTRQRHHVAAAEQQLARLAAERPRAFARRLTAYASGPGTAPPATPAKSSPPTQPEPAKPEPAKPKPRARRAPRRTPP